MLLKIIKKAFNYLLNFFSPIEYFRTFFSLSLFSFFYKKARKSAFSIEFKLFIILVVYIISSYVSLINFEDSVVLHELLESGDFLKALENFQKTPAELSNEIERFEEWKKVNDVRYYLRFTRASILLPCILLVVLL